ncbi:MAG: flagellar basal body L-ring protein FlgH [Negativicutes bacterium]|nr:flagellar basal body L-ring protein FlgH [Negativicutes bacterium]
MRSTRFLSIALVAAGLCWFSLWGMVQAAGESTSDGSLWMDSGSNADLYSDHGALGVGDVITILVVEKSTAERSGQSSNKKSAEVEFADGSGWMAPIIGAAGTGYSDSFNAQGKLTNSNAVTAQITATVVEVLPNGNVRLEGTKVVRQNNDEQKIIISGVARPRDILSNNTVYSYQLADAKVELVGNGPIDSKQKQGILTQIFNFLF